MNLTCLNCGHGFNDELDSVTCDGCERLSHREPCGEYELIYRDGQDEPTAYFFCNSCYEMEEEE
jgi:hypothetical protein